MEIRKIEPCKKEHLMLDVRTILYAYNGDADIIVALTSTGGTLDHENVSTQAREGLKFGFESVKQLTTVSSGSIVLISTFSKVILPTTANGQLLLDSTFLKCLLVTAFVSLGISTVLAAYATFWHTSLMRDLGSYGSHTLYQQGRQRSVFVVMLISFWLFILGLGCFSWLVLVSLL